MAVRLDDARRENKFGIKEMILRSEWSFSPQFSAQHRGLRLRLWFSG